MIAQNSRSSSSEALRSLNQKFSQLEKSQKVATQTNMPLMSDLPISVKQSVQEIFELACSSKDSEHVPVRTSAKQEKLQTILLKFHSHMKAKNDELAVKLSQMPSLESEIKQSEGYLLRLNEQKIQLNQKLSQLQQQSAAITRN